MPAWMLPTAYWLHMAATVIWIGGLVFQAVVLFPLLETAIDAPTRARLLESVRRRFEPLAWLSLAVLVATGLTQMAAHPLYQGVLVIQNQWSAAILAKHVAVGAMVLLSAYQTWGLHPQLGRQALLEARGITGERGPWMRRQRLLSRASLALGLLVLALTALARTA